MANATVPTFGPNNTPITTIRNTAIPSWNGFVYQGMCGLYVALLTLKNDFDGSKDFLLGLEGYEDFVIQDAARNILSFHQCKAYGQAKDFEDEFKKMEDKRWYWHDQGKCFADARLYFHCNQQLAYSHGVQPYKYHNNADTVSLVGIYSLIKEVVGLILHERNIPGSAVEKTAQLIYLIDRHVSWLHYESMITSTGKDGFEVATDNPIPFQKIAEVLTKTSVKMNKQELARCIRYYFQLILEERMLMHPTNKDGHVKTFISEMGKLDADQLLDLMQRISPDVKFDSEEAEREMVASAKPNNFHQVLTETLHELDYPSVKWSNNGDIFSPSSLGCDLYPDDQSAKIVGNPHVAALLWDCRWIVGNVKGKVDDVREEAKKISQMPIDYTKFTKPGKLGMLTIDDFNNDNY